MNHALYWAKVKHSRVRNLPLIKRLESRGTATANLQ